MKMTFKALMGAVAGLAIADLGAGRRHHRRRRQLSFPDLRQMGCRL